MNDPQKLFGLTIIERIDETPKSIIYRCHKENDKQSYILKFLKNKQLTQTEIIRFKKEYEILKKINIDGANKVFDIYETADNLALLLEDFNGYSLKKLIVKEKISIQRFLQISIRLAQIIGDIHQNNIVHKDIKPSNILITPDTDIVRLIDFGISKDFDRTDSELDKKELALGTLVYMSPEQSGRMNRKVDYRSDIYSFGITMYEILTGTVPFISDDPLDIIFSHIAKSPLPPHKLDNEIPEPISEIILKALQKNPEDRYQNCYGIMEDLTICLRQIDTKGIISPFELGQHDYPVKLSITQKLYGRDKEIKQIASAFDHIAHDNKEIILVSGPTGIGKSFLINEIQRIIMAKNGHFIDGKYEELSGNQPYSSIITAFRKLMKYLLSDTENNIAMWRKKIKEALENNGQIITDIIPEVEIIIGKQPEVPSLGLNENRERFNSTFKKFASVFAQKKHPLVIFLDDLQWVDSSSLELIQYIAMDPQIKCLLLIMSYRETDSDNFFRFMETIEALKTNNLKFLDLELQPLKVHQVSQLIIDILKCEENIIIPLANLIFKKTNGNPLFVSQLIKTIYDNKLLKLVNIESPHEKKKWQWNLEKIKQIKIKSNIIDLMVASIVGFSEDTRTILKAASCIGGSFDLDTIITLVNKDLDFILSKLNEAIEAGLLSYYGNEYRFEHDKIREAVYAMIPDPEKSKLHYAIGNYFLKKHSNSAGIGNEIFYIAHQLNLGINSINNNKETIDLARLNLQAGIKAKTSSAFKEAAQFLNQGLAILPINAWNEFYVLSLSLFTENVEVSIINGNHIKAKEYINEILNNARDKLDKVPIYVMQMDYYTGINQTDKALQIGIEALHSFGFNMPKKASSFSLLKEKFITWLLLKRHKIDNLAIIQEIKDPNKLAIVRLIRACNQPAYVGHPDYFPLVALKNLNYTLKNGNSPLALYAYIIYGLLCASEYQFDLAYKFGKLALELLKKFNSEHLTCRINFLFGGMINHWKKHYSSDIDYLWEAHKSGYATGDLLWSYTAIVNLITHELFMGTNLNEIINKYSKFQEPIKNFKQNRIIGQFELQYQVMEILTDHNREYHKIQGKYFNEDETIPLWKKMKDFSGVGYYTVYKQMLFVIFNDYEASIQYAEEGEQYLPSMAGQLFVGMYTFYYALALISFYPDAPKEKRKTLMKKITSSHSALKQLSVWSKDNYLHRFLLVEAELNYINGDIDKAINFYHDAINLAEKNNFLQDEAIAYELLGRLYRKRGLKKIARVYLNESYKRYRQWGASKKLSHMISYYKISPVEFLRERLLTKNKNIKSTTGTTSDTLDLSTVIKASQTISSEIVLNKLLVKLLNFSLINAGAQKGYMILEENNTFMIKVKGEMENDEITVLESMPLEGYKDLPHAVINYVIRMKDSLLIDNAASNPEFFNDPYIKENRIKSILCIPIINQGKLNGILYLENNLTSCAFTQQRVDVLKIISAQVAVSIYNAMLYEHLEEKVKERTKELNEVNDDLIETNKILEIQAKVADALNSDLYDTNKELKRAQAIADRDLKMAINTQASFLTKDIPTSLEWEIAYEFKPMAGVSGDFYDFFIYDDKLSGVGLFDVSGHGIASGLITMIAKSIIFRTFDKGYNSELSEVITTINQLLQNEIGNVNNYLTGLLLRLYKNKVEYVNAAHPDIYVKSKGSVQAIRKDDGNSLSGFYLGMAGMTLPFESITFPINSNDYILLYSDCLLESKANNETYGQERLVQSFQTAPVSSAENVLNHILNDFYNFLGRNDKLDDDLTIIIVKRL